MATTLDSFRPQVQAEVPACPAIVIDGAIRDACRTIAWDTWAVRSDIPVTTIADTQSYTLSAPADHEVIAVKSVVMGGDTLLTPYSGSVPASVRLIMRSGTPQAFWYRAGNLWLYPVPTDVRTLVAEAVIQPTRTAATVDDRFLNYAEAIGYWALYRLKAATGQAWTDEAGARFNYQRYADITLDIRTAFDTSGTSGSRRVCTNFF